jgi:hypothetical protein
MSKKSLKRRIQDLEDQNEVLNEDLDSLYDEHMALVDRVDHLWNFTPPKVDPKFAASQITDGWKIVNDYAGQFISLANSAKGVFDLGPKPKINDEG